MKLVLILFFAFIFASNAKPSTKLDKKCSLGQLYWCQNLTTAAGCNAVKHCIQNVWEQMDVPEDKGEICQICLDMVKQARDQLQSNETQEELKEVFEGSCKLIPLKIVSNECCRLADEFIPELVETLSSQMNPTTVCSVAGLCNSASNDKLLSKIHSVNRQLEDDNAPNSQKCSGCGLVVSQMKENFNSKSRDQVLESLLKICGYVSSYSDSCSSLIIVNFNSIYQHLQEHLIPDEVCHLAGVCADRYHVHDDAKTLDEAVEIVHESSVGFIETKPKDELTCQFCEQLVIHLRDILVANTTELEFEQVLRGLCQQTGSFKTECSNLVSEYYATLYNWLINGLKEKQVCALMGVCPEPSNSVKKGPLYRVQIQTGGMSKIRVIKPKQKIQQLPKDILLMPQSILLGASKEECALCEYFLHFVQEELIRPSSEEQIKVLVEKACDRFPATLKAECKSFVETYEPALVAILAQEIDPSIVCPSLGICPKSVFVEEKPVCPLCLLAVEGLMNKLRENKTEEAIRHELENLCSSLPKSLVEECSRFVDKYEEDLIDSVIANFSSQEVCAFLKLCDTRNPNPTSEPSTTTAQGFYRYNPDEDIETNEIPNFPMEKIRPTLDDKTLTKPQESNVCVLCEFVLSKIDNMLKDKATEKEIKDTVNKVCGFMPKTVKDECLQFVKQYGDLVITLLAEELDPEEVCSAIKLCQNSSSMFLDGRRAILECHICEMFLGAVEGLLSDQGIERDVAGAVSRGCTLLPSSDQQECNYLVQAYGPLIIDLVNQFVSGPMICHKIKLCPSRERRNIIQPNLGSNKCTWGPSYWCESINNAKSCGDGAVNHCTNKVWMKV